MFDNNNYVDPSGQRYDLTLVNQAEARAHEIATVTPITAPELLSLYCRASFSLGRYLHDLYLAHQRAVKMTANRKAVMIIDVIPSLVESSKKTSQNADVRQGYVDLDPEYSNLLDIETQYEAGLMYFKRKIEDMENGINSIKKVIDATHSMYDRPNYNLSIGSISQESQTEMVSGMTFGKARY
jgi:hypothetical protein